VNLFHIKDFLNRKKLDALLITNIKNVRYLSSFSGSNGQILISKDKNYFLTDGRYSEQSKNQIAKDFQILIYKKFENTLKKLIKKDNIKKVGFESKNLTYAQFLKYSKLLGIELEPCIDVVEDGRAKKTPQEFDKIKSAIKVAEKSLTILTNQLFSGMKEIDFARLLENEMIKNGADSISFPTIVVSGSRSSLVHGTPSDFPIDKSIILIDFGALYEGYCSDKTVTYMSKDSDKEKRDIYNIVKDAKNYAIENIKHGVKGKDIDKVARDYIHSKGYGKYFLHSLGHGVGIEVHEEPYLSYQSKSVIKEGMVLTVEPGIYISGYCGVRLEDMVLVKSDGVELLTEPAEKFFTR